MASTNSKGVGYLVLILVTGACIFLFFIVQDLNVAPGSGFGEYIKAIGRKTGDGLAGALG